MSWMFYDCNNLVDLDLSSFDTNNVTTMYNMFSYCIKLTDMKLNNFNIDNVTNYNGMFSGIPTKVTILTNSAMASWIAENFATYASCVTII